MSNKLEIKISGRRITKALVLPDGTCELTVERVPVKTTLESSQKNTQNFFKLVEASQLSVSDEFMQYEPQTDPEIKFKELISEAIKSGLKDFYRPVLDPSFNDDMTGICYEFGKKPAVGMSYHWWMDVAKKFESGSHLGTRYEYVAFLGVLIKKLVESGWSISESWKAVCMDSKELGNYRNFPNGKYKFQNTGSKKVFGFYDLANTKKILAKDKETYGSWWYDFWLASGSFNDLSFCYDLAYLEAHKCGRNVDKNSVGWIVISTGN